MREGWRRGEGRRDARERGRVDVVYWKAA